MSGTSTEKAEAQASVEDGKRIQNFEEAFARIRSATGIEDIEELVRNDCKIGRARIQRVKILAHSYPSCCSQYYRCCVPGHGNCGLECLCVINP